MNIISRKMNIISRKINIISKKIKINNFKKLAFPKKLQQQHLSKNV
jgi:hypothetical protein